MAVQLALRLDAEIVTADSMQVYRGLPTLTNQPDAGEAARVRRHLVGIVDPSEEFSVARYAALAQAAIEDVLARGHRVVVEGGSGLYVRAALGGLDFRPPPDAATRAELTQRLERDGLAALAAELARLDPATAAAADLANPRRVLRALEAVLARGAPLDPASRDSLWRAGGRHPHAVVALDAEREWLRRRVDERVERMFAAGAVDEVRHALAAGPLSATVLQAIGVREVVAFLEGSLDLAAAVQRTKARTRRLVRRQATWMRKLPAAVRIPVTDLTADEAVARIVAALDPVFPPSIAREAP